MVIERSGGRRCPAVVRRAVRATTAETVLQVALVGAAWLLVVQLQSGPTVVERALGVLAFAAGVAATILLAVGAWMSADRRARRVAGAVGLYTGIELLMRTVDAGHSGVTALLGSVAVLGVVGLLVLAVSSGADRRRDRVAAIAVVGLVIGAMGVIAVTGVALHWFVPSAEVIAAADLVAWSGAGAAGLMVLAAGVIRARPLLRRAGLAFGTLSVAQALRIVADQLPGSGTSGIDVSALELAAVAMFLVAAGPFLFSAVRAVARQQEASRTRVAEADAVMAGVAERDHELRNVVAGLSGAARVLTGDQAGESLDGRRLLVAAGAELERLQRMLDGGEGSGWPQSAPVGTVLRDLALVHRAGGLAVRVEVEGDPQAAVEPGILAQVLTNLLVNCARHAPGAHVWLRARTRGRKVRIEVVDDGPGLPPGSTATLLRRGVRGPDSTGDGLGLAITAELVERNHGTFTVISGGHGCTAVLDLPAARVRAVAQTVGA